jgi:4-nitrophenyl phosphatase/phosphoglycolate phosphatase
MTLALLSMLVCCAASLVQGESEPLLPQLLPLLSREAEGFTAPMRVPAPAAPAAVKTKQWDPLPLAKGLYGEVVQDLAAFGRAAALRGGARTPSSRSGAEYVVASAATTIPEGAESMRKNGLCEKLTVPSDLLDKTDVFIFDCDGVIWKGDTLIDGVPAVLDMLRANGKRIFFVTNNSTKSRKGYLGKFKGLGLEGVEPEEIFSSSFAAAAYLEQTNFKASGKKVYVIGETGIAEELDLIGVPWIGAGDDAGKKIELKSGYALPHDPDVGAVVVGFDREINYHKIQYAQLCINENDQCEFIATNLDAVTHLTDAQEWAGNGAMAGAIKGCTGVEPTLVGKPSALIIDYIVQKYNCERARICMVGDRLDTDILFGQNNGLQTCLTLSGVTTEEKLLSKENDIKPDYYVPSIAAFQS